MLRKILNTLLASLAVVLAAAPVAGQALLQTDLGRTPAASMAVGDHGKVVLSAPDESGTTLLVAQPQGRWKKHRFEGKFLRAARVFPDGRILVGDAGNKALKVGAWVGLMLDAKGDRVVWRTPHFGRWSFDPTGHYAVWTPCLYCASEMPESGAGKEAAWYVDKGLAIAIEDTRRPATGKFSLLRAPTLDEAVSNAGPLDLQVEAFSGRRALVVLNRVPYIFEEWNLRLLDPDGQMGPVFRLVAVSPSGKQLLFDLGRGRYAVWDVPSARVVWESEARKAFWQVVERELGVSLSGRAANGVWRWFVGENAVAFMYPGVGIVTLSLRTHRMARAIAWPRGKKLAETEPRPKVTAGLVKVAVSDNGRTMATLDQGQGAVNLATLSSLD